MTALELKVNALVLIEVGSAEEQEQGRETLRMLRDGLIPAPTLEDTLDELLDELGMIEYRVSYQVIRGALVRGWQCPRLMDYMSSGLYPDVGAQFHMTVPQVAQAISNGIDSMYKHGNDKKLDAFFGCAVSEVTGKPTPVRFLRRCMRELRKRMEV